MRRAVFGKRVLILAPHPDDEVVGCFAAARRARSAGAAVDVLFLTTGVPAREVLWPWQRRAHARWVERRRQEAIAAAALMGTDPAGFLDVPTRTLRNHMEQALTAIRGVAVARGSDTLWVPAYEGAHQDHDVAHYLASRLDGLDSIWEFAEYNFAGGSTRSQTFFDANGMETVIELDRDESKAKRQALAAYRSEQRNLGAIGVARESLRPYKPADYARAPHPGTLFFARFQWVPFHHPRVDFTPHELVRRQIAEHAKRPD